MSIPIQIMKPNKITAATKPTIESTRGVVPSRDEDEDELPWSFSARTVNRKGNSGEFFAGSLISVSDMAHKHPGDGLSWTKESGLERMDGGHPKRVLGQRKSYNGTGQRLGVDGIDARWWRVYRMWITQTLKYLVSPKELAVVAKLCIRKR